MQAMQAQTQQQSKTHFFDQNKSVLYMDCGSVLPIVGNIDFGQQNLESPILQLKAALISSGTILPKDSIAWLD